MKIDEETISKIIKNLGNIRQKIDTIYNNAHSITEDKCHQLRTDFQNLETCIGKLKEIAVDKIKNSKNVGGRRRKAKGGNLFEKSKSEMQISKENITEKIQDWIDRLNQFVESFQNYNGSYEIPGEIINYLQLNEFVPELEEYKQKAFEHAQRKYRKHINNDVNAANNCLNSVNSSEGGKNQRHHYVKDLLLQKLKNIQKMFVKIQMTLKLKHLKLNLHIKRKSHRLYLNKNSHRLYLKK